MLYTTDNIQQINMMVYYSIILSKKTLCIFHDYIKIIYKIYLWKMILANIYKKD